ncbi:MAG: hypothetical protein WD029_06285, partial [Microthrixaceae bacterium]
AEPRDSLEAAFLAALIALREHPLLDQLIRTEPDALLPLLTTDGGPVMSQVRGVVELIILMGYPEIDSGSLHRSADLITRLLISYAVSAPDDPPEVVANFVATSLFPQFENSSGASPFTPPTTAPTATTATRPGNFPASSGPRSKANQ